MKIPGWQHVLPTVIWTWLVAFPPAELAALPPQPVANQESSKTDARDQHQPSVAPTESAVDDDPLKNFLRTHQLHRLLADVIERELSATTDQVRRRSLARELTTLYAKQLDHLQGSDFDRVSVRLGELATEFPEATSLRIQTNITLGAYHRAKSLFEEWIWQRENGQLRDSVRQQFDAVVERTERLLSHQPRQNESAEHEVTEVDSPSIELEALNSQLQYLRAWSRYYGSLTIEAANRRPLLEQCLDDFRQLLQVPEERNVNDLNPGWFDLDSEWSCRTLLGLAMASQALQQQPQADYCFQLLGDDKVPDLVRDNRSVWQFHAYFFPGQIQSAAELAERWQQQPNAPQNASLWSAVATAGMTWPDQQSAEAIQLASIGLSALAKQNEFSLIDELIELGPPREIAGDNFYSRWLTGYIELKKSGGDDTMGLQRALDQLARSGQASESESSLIDRARCRYHYGFALYYSGQFQEAAEQLRRVSVVLRQLDPAMAEHALWVRCQSFDKLAAQDANWLRPLKYSLDEFRQVYPDSIHVPHAIFLTLKNDVRDLPFDQAIAKLQTVESDDANYERALFEICRLRHQRWSRAVASDNDESIPDQIQQLADDVSRATQNLLSVSHKDQPDSILRHIKACLLASDMHIRHRPPNLPAAESLLARCRQWLEHGASNQELLSEYHFLELSIGLKRSDRQRIANHVDWLIDHSSIPAHRRAALIAQAELIEQEIDSHSDPIPPEKIRLAVDTYQELVDQYVEENISIDDNANARVAWWKLAKYLTRLGEYQRAALLMRHLHESQPRQLRYVLELARLTTRMNQDSDGIELWRRITAGSAPGDPAWVEAKYNLALCFAESDPERARQILDQTLLLAPQVPPPWSDKLADLKRRLDK